MFEVLSQFVEEECEPEIIEWYGDDGRKITVNGEVVYARDEIQYLYDWWHVRYNGTYEILQQSIDAYVDSIPFVIGAQSSWDLDFETEEDAKHFHAAMRFDDMLEYYKEKDLNSKLRRILNIRKYLWT